MNVEECESLHACGCKITWLKTLKIMETTFSVSPPLMELCVQLSGLFVSPIFKAIPSSQHHTTARLHISDKNTNYDVIFLQNGQHL